jgi:hypothetical protein
MHKQLPDRAAGKKTAHVPFGIGEECNLLVDNNNNNNASIYVSIDIFNTWELIHIALHSD